MHYELHMPGGGLVVHATQTDTTRVRPVAGGGVVVHSTVAVGAPRVILHLDAALVASIALAGRRAHDLDTAEAILEGAPTPVCPGCDGRGYVVDSHTDQTTRPCPDCRHGDV